MSCSIVTAERVEALLSGRLAPADRAALAEHLRSPCEACRGVLGSVEGERILSALAREEAVPSAAEAERRLEPAIPGTNPAGEQAKGLWAKVVEWMGGAAWRPALGVAVLLLAAAPVVFLALRAGPDPRGGQGGVEGGPGPASARVQAKLIGVVAGRFQGKPYVARKAGQREQLRPGEVLLVRFRLLAPAAVHLQIAGPKASLGVWPDGSADTEPQPALMPVGEHALVAARQVLPVQTLDYGSPTRVTMVASPRPFPDGFSFARDPRALAAACPDCAVEVLEVLPPPEGVEPDESFR
jgi:hypothetical protein